MKPPEEIKKYFKNATLSTNQEKHEAIFEKILSAQEQTNEQEPEYSRIKLGRFIMKSHFTKFAAAATIIIACVIGVTFFSTTSNVVLANVLTKIEKISTYMYEMDMTTEGQIIADRTLNINMHGTALYSYEYGQKITMDMTQAGQNITMRQEIYVIPKDKVLFQIMPDQKTYTRMEVDDEYIERIKDQNYDPGKIIGQVISCKYESLGTSTIEGKTVEGFQTNDPNYAGGMYSTVDIKLWVDVKTQLPVQMDMNFQLEGQTNASVSGVIHNFQWNIPVNASEIEPVIPDDYKSATSGSVKMPSNTEEAAIEGLKQYVEFFGNYPKEMNLMTLISQMSKITDVNSPAATQLKEKLEGLSQEEKSQMLMDNMMSMAGAVQFYMLLVQDQKNPAYYGDRVSPGEKAQVLMRWKVSDYDYRVIYGDLRVETIPFEILVQLEQNLPEKQETEN
ncbi:MAG: hypothetical protein JXA96_17835 [Sedimentisphaerales bacterium]|nr:hypothetical protein [Sedimentisphaerales bacterium]